MTSCLLNILDILNWLLNNNNFINLLIKSLPPSPPPQSSEPSMKTIELVWL